VDFTVRILIGAALLVLSTLASKISSRYGIPVLLIFLFLGMLSGSDGLGQIHFDNPLIVQQIGSIALVFILFTGGVDAHWDRAKKYIRAGLLLSTVGVIVSAVIVAAFVVFLFDFSWLEGLLLGAIVSSTDAPAVFTSLRSNNIALKDGIAETAELESGSNDPMAIFLVLAFIGLIQDPLLSIPDLLLHFIQEMSLGLAGGYLFGVVSVIAVNKLKLEFEGLYPVLTIALVFLAYASIALVGGNGFLAVYVMGLVFGDRKTYYKRTLSRFYDGVGWLMQIVMFLILGLQVFPTRMAEVLLSGIGISLFLMFVARPASVLLALIPTKFSVRDKLMIAWMGMRGAVPIILATFPVTAGIEKADFLFHLVFFVVLTSVLIQGMTLSGAAQKLKVISTQAFKRIHEQRHGTSIHDNSEIMDFIVPYNSPMVGKSVMDLDLPQDALVVLISREEGTVAPTGRTLLEGGDVLVIVGSRHISPAVAAKLTS
jgi:cell volume regulation protein A